MFVYLFLRLVCVHPWYLLIINLLIVSLLILGRRDTIKLIWPSFSLISHVVVTHRFSRFPLLIINLLTINPL